METETTTVDKLKAPKGKRKEVAEEFKIYEFELVQSYENQRPKEKLTDKPMGSPFPPSFGYPNHGIAYDEAAGMARNWRYIEGQPSIWVDEQPSLEKYERKQINELLGQSENQLEFRDGKMMVRGMQQLRLTALMIQDYFEGKQTKYRQVQKQYMFRLNNPDEQVKVGLNSISAEYEAMKAAMDCTVEKMLAASFIMGINVDDTSNEGLNKIKLQFLSKAKADPKNPKALEFFLGVMSNPATDIGYVFAQGLSQGLISSSQQPGKLTWAKSNAAIFDIVGRIGLGDELTAMVMDKHKGATVVMEEIKKQLV